MGRSEDVPLINHHEGSDHAADHARELGESERLVHVLDGEEVGEDDGAVLQSVAHLHGQVHQGKVEEHHAGGADQAPHHQLSTDFFAGVERGVAQVAEHAVRETGRHETSVERHVVDVRGW